MSIIDGVKAGFTDKWLDNIRSLVDIKDIKYLVVQHTEPDHSGAIPALLALIQILKFTRFIYGNG